MALESSVVWPTYGNGYKLSQSVIVFFSNNKVCKIVEFVGPDQNRYNTWLVEFTHI